MLLLYRRGGLGDTLLTFPVLENLKKLNKKVLAVGNTDYLEIAKEIGWADQIASEMVPDWQGERIIISVDGNVKPFPEKREWIVKYYLRSLGLGYSFSNRLPLKSSNASPLKNKVVLHPSSGSRKKNPSIELFHRIEHFLRKEGLRYVYLLGPADEHLRGSVKPYWESYKPLEVAKALLDAKLFIGLDSGLSHLASYCGVPCLLFYGPTDHILWKPIGRQTKIIRLGLRCSPCFPNVCQDRPCLDVDALFERFLSIQKSFP